MTHMPIVALLHNANGACECVMKEPISDEPDTCEFAFSSSRISQQFNGHWTTHVLLNMMQK